MAQDIFGKNVGTMVVLDASEAEITLSGLGQTGFVMNASVNYNQNIAPVATFGKDVLLVKQAPQGSFTFGSIAGSLNLAGALAKATCSGTTVTMRFKPDKCKGAYETPTSEALKQIMEGKKTEVTMHGAILSQFSIQGTAQDAFFTNNLGGMFHYLTMD